jgi:hypothetical protein
LAIAPAIADAARSISAIVTGSALTAWAPK